MKLVHLQVLRAVAALLVVVYHAQHEAALIAARAGTGFRPSALLPWEAGVDVFFVISGFIMVHASAPLFGQPGGRRRFMAHRVARLVPLYWLVTAAYLAIALAMPGLLSGGSGSGPPDASYVAASFLFWPAARPDGFAVPLYGLGWTLNYEMFFYVLFAIGLGWGRRKAVAWIVAILSVLTLARLAVPGLPLPLSFWTNPIVLEFALGALIGLARAEGLRLGTVPRCALAICGVLLLSLAPDAADRVLRTLAYGLPAACLVAAAGLGRAAEQTEGSPFRRLAVGSAVALGDASYALYLVHPFVLRALREAILRTGLAPILGPWGSLAVMLGLSAFASILVFRLVERPLTRGLRALLDPQPERRDQKMLEDQADRVSRGAKRI